MFLIRLVYTSTKDESFQSADIEGILSAARKNNKTNNVTGMLCFNRNYFLQCLEGTREDVNNIYHKIAKDPRHHNMMILDYQEVTHREFDQWYMGYMPESSLTAPINLKYSGTPYFEPYEMSGESALNMLIALRETIPPAS